MLAHHGQLGRGYKLASASRENNPLLKTVAAMSVLSVTIQTLEFCEPQSRKLTARLAGTIDFLQLYVIPAGHTVNSVRRLGQSS